MTDVRQEYIDRLLHLDACRKDKKLRSLEFEMCRRNKVHFINKWLFTYDPRRAPKHFPFTLYPFQEDAIKWISDRYNNKENGIIEKSRDLGVSWLICAWTVHEWIFGNGFTGLFGSRKEDLVDDQTINSLFGKMRYTIRRLPEFLCPTLREGTKEDRYLTLINPINGNEIVGESANIGFGRGGRSSICFIDEFAFVQHSEAVWASISENSDCVIPVSTPNGKSNQFAWLRHETPIKRLTLHWKSHPLKTEEWYQDKKKEMKPWQIAQELDLSYDRSLQGKVYRRFERRWHIAEHNIQFNPDYEQWVTWDFGIADPTAIIWGQVTPDGVIEVIHCYQLAGFDIDFHIPISKGMRPSIPMNATQEEIDYVDKKLKKVKPIHKADHYGDHAGVARTANSRRSCRDALISHGISMKSTGKNDFAWRISCVDNILKLRHNQTRNEWYSILRVSPDCTEFIDAMNNYEYDGDADQISDEKIRPKHNWASHLVSAFEFFVTNRFPIKKPGFKSYSEVRIR